MCCCNPSPFPHVSLMYINPDSRGQCVLGEVKLLSSQSITFNLHSSACGPRSGSEMCLAFPKTGRLFGVNQRDTNGPERPWIYPYVCLNAFIVWSFVPGSGRQWFFFFFIPMGCNIFSCKKKKKLKPFLTDWLTNQEQHHLVTANPTWNGVNISCQTARVCVISPWDQRLPMGLLSAPPVTLCSPSSVTC